MGLKLLDGCGHLWLGGDFQERAHQLHPLPMERPAIMMKRREFWIIVSSTDELAAVKPATGELRRLSWTAAAPSLYDAGSPAHGRKSETRFSPTLGDHP
jgi:hypothetical protein